MNVNSVHKYSDEGNNNDAFRKKKNISLRFRYEWFLAGFWRIFQIPHTPMDNEGIKKPQGEEVKRAVSQLFQGQIKAL